MTAPLAPRPPDALAQDALTQDALAQDALTQPEGPPGFFTGTRELFAGLGYIVRTPAAWPLALVPVAVAGVVTVLVGATLLAIVTPRVAALVGDHAVLAVLATILAGVLALILAALIGAGVAQPLSGPALNRLVRGAEAELGAPPWPQIGFVEDIGRALGSMMVGYIFGLPLLAILATITFFLPPAAVITFPLKLVVLAILFAWDFCDYPLSLHGMPLGKRIALVVRHARAMIGFGLGLALLSLIPCAPFFALPIGVAGAARLVQRIERSEGGQRPAGG